MITPSFALTATERVLPRLALDFTTASLDPRITFTRTGNTATVINSSGFVVPINANLPRFDYNPSTLVCNGLLIEESRINLLLYSAVFNNAAWNTNVTVNLTSGLSSPDGENNAFTVTATGANSVLGQVVTSATGAYSFSLWIRRRTGTGTIALSAGPNAPITINVTSSWQKLSVTNTATTTTIRAYLHITNSGDAVDIWGAQLEAGAFATSYIPTVATAVTRNADVATMTGTNFSSWYTATTGAASVWAIPQTATGTRPVIQFDDTTANEIIALRGNVANPELYVVDGGAPQAQIDAGTIVANTAYKLTGTWNTDSCAAAQNGAAVVTDNTATIPTPTQLRIGSDGTNYVCAWVQKVMYWPQRIINAEVQAFSK